MGPQGAAHYFETLANSKQYGMHVCICARTHTLTHIHRFSQIRTGLHTHTLCCYELNVSTVFVRLMEFKVSAAYLLLN